MDTQYKSIAVICRQEYDDEDSCFIYRDMTRQQAIDAAVEDVIHTEGRLFYLNNILVSDSPIVSIY